jgi:hypothetical protein
MRFLCLVYFEPQTLAALSPGEKAALNRNSMAYNDELTRNSHYIVAEALQPVRSARTVRVRQGKRSVTDGPFAETKEHVGGFILIEAADMNQALEIAAGIPLAKLGSIEVRPIMKIMV